MILTLSGREWGLVSTDRALRLLSSPQLLNRISTQNLITTHKRQVFHNRLSNHDSIKWITMDIRQTLQRIDMRWLNQQNCQTIIGLLITD